MEYFLFLYLFFLETRIKYLRENYLVAAKNTLMVHPFSRPVPTTSSLPHSPFSHLEELKRQLSTNFFI